MIGFYSLNKKDYWQSEPLYNKDLSLGLLLAIWQRHDAKEYPTATREEDCRRYDVRNDSPYLPREGAECRTPLGELHDGAFAVLLTVCIN